MIVELHRGLQTHTVDSRTALTIIRFQSIPETTPRNLKPHRLFKKPLQKHSRTLLKAICYYRIMGIHNHNKHLKNEVLILEPTWRIQELSISILELHSRCQNCTDNNQFPDYSRATLKVPGPH